MTVETGQQYELVGTIVSWSVLLLMGINGVTNSAWVELDYNALFDAIDGSQLISFVAAMGAELPPDVSAFYATIRGAVSVEPTEMLLGEEETAILFNIFGETPPTEPLNTQLAGIGYTDMIPMDEISAASVMFATEIAGIFLLLLSLFCSKKCGSALAERLGINLQ